MRQRRLTVRGSTQPPQLRQLDELEFWPGGTETSKPDVLPGELCAAEIDAVDPAEFHRSPPARTCGSISTAGIASSAERMNRLNHPSCAANSCGGPCSVT